VISADLAEKSFSTATALRRERMALHAGQPAIRPTVVRDYLAPFQNWIETTLGVKVDAAVLLEVDSQFGRLAAVEK
jgi:hypothetical protein